MRIFLPLTAPDEHVLREGSTRVPLAHHRAAWAVHPAAQAAQPGTDPEDLEYDALQDAIHVAFSALPAGAADARAVVLAADVPDAAVTQDADGGAYGVRLDETEARLAALHVTELGQADADASDTDPAVLWFDASEARDALDYRDRRGEATPLSPR